MRGLSQRDTGYFFVHLGQFARDRQFPALTQNSDEVFDTFQNPVRGLIEDQSRIDRRQMFEFAAARRLTRRQETDKEEMRIRDPGSRKGSDHRAGSGDRNDRKARGLNPGHDPRTGVRDRGSSCIGHQRDLLALLQQGHKPIRGSLFVVLMHGQKPRIDAMVIEQATRVAGVLGGHRINTSQHSKRAKTYVK